ncbi:MAG: LPS export ABC transporter periplasmic protein LptC [Alphaproteobacteria bacterium]|nr:LPS export ABC transporter periplasmic protein LptC [Alphaproteobacteria bacterium]
MPRAKSARGPTTEPLKVPHERRDWTARARGTALDAIRYSQFVSLMKRALPIAAAAVLAAVLVYSFLPRPSDKITLTAQHTGVLDNDLTMEKPKLTGADDDGNPFVITAEKAVQDPKHLRRVRLSKIEADMTMQDGRWLNATASQGFFDMESGALNLSGGIAMYSDSGYELHTDRLEGEMKKGTFHGPAPVSGHGPFGSLSADRFEYDRIKQELHLLGNVRTNFTIPRHHR